MAATAVQGSSEWSPKVAIVMIICNILASSVFPVWELSKYVLIFSIGGQKSPISFVKNSGLYK